MENPSPLSGFATVTATLRVILCSLMAGLGAWRIEPALALVVHRRISVAFSQIERLLMRFRAGRVSQARVRVAAPTGRGRKTCSAPLPRRFGWLVQAGGYQVACFGSQLRTVLQTPEMTEFLAASAQARRILRPLCRALAMEVPGIVPKARVAATQSGEPKRRIRKPRPKPAPFRIPLPRGVLSAARRQGFGKDPG